MSDEKLISPQEARLSTTVFYGIRKGERTEDGAFCELVNMTGDDFPCLSSRPERAFMKFTNDIKVSGEPVKAVDIDGNIAVLCSNGIVSYKGSEIDTRAYGSDVIRFNNKVFVAPSCAYTDGASLTFAGCYISGGFMTQARNSAGEDIEILTEKPDSPVGGEYWYDKAAGGIYRYSSLVEEWTAAAALYMYLKPITVDGFIEDILSFNEGDAVTIDYGDEKLETFVASCSGEGITVEAAKPFTSDDLIYLSIERKRPELQFCCEHNNRIWGCCSSGEYNEIYASRLGDPLNWYCYRGLSTDSYTVSVGAPGKFTGVVSLDDSVVFFKEMCIITVYGNEPSSYQTVRTDCFGVQEGSERSIVKINGSVYFKSCHGIMRLSEGAYPVCISEALGDDVWHDAIAGTDGNKYYVSMSDSAGKRYLYVYDTRTDLWHKETEPFEIFSMLYYKNNLLLIGKNSTDSAAKYVRRMYEGLYPSVVINGVTYSAAGLYSKTDEEIRALYETNEGEGLTDEEFYDVLSSLFYIEPCVSHTLSFAFSSSERTCNRYFLEDNERAAVQSDEGRFLWRAETGLRGFEISDCKRLKCLELCMKLGVSAKCDVSIKYNAAGKWEPIYSFEGEGVSTYRIKGRFDKCDVYSLRLQGYGKIVLYGLSEIYEEAGNIGF